MPGVCAQAHPKGPKQGIQLCSPGVLQKKEGHDVTTSTVGRHTPLSGLLSAE